MSEKIEIIKSPPPFWNKLQEKFAVAWDQGIAVTYGNTIYSKFDLPDHVMVHEKVHVRQQNKMGKDLWWEKYLEDSKFRLEQEIPAYRAQMKFIEKNFNSKGKKILRTRLAKDLSNMYGDMNCTYMDAFSILDGKIDPV